jgi:hypothetical protein
MFDHTLKRLGNELLAQKSLWTKMDMYNELVAHMFNKAVSKCAHGLILILLGYC